MPPRRGILPSFVSRTILQSRLQPSRPAGRRGMFNQERRPNKMINAVRKVGRTTRRIYQSSFATVELAEMKRRYIRRVREERIIIQRHRVDLQEIQAELLHIIKLLKGNSKKRLLIENQFVLERIAMNFFKEMNGRTSFFTNRVAQNKEIIGEALRQTEEMLSTNPRLLRDKTFVSSETINDITKQGIQGALQQQG